MCMDHRKTCVCGRKEASFNFRDELLPVETLDRLFCPDCSDRVAFNPDTMLQDNGWIIEYDIEIAHLTGHKLPAAQITPEFLFDEGFCTWRGLYPGDREDSVREREELIKLSKINPKQYVTEFRNWSIQRMQKLADDGWRKARAHA